ncbi:MAG: hypothetical protein EBU85_08135, partial [Actinobacteria bacterium]|nr:hypothetical protein [Actinomycetota bacterium]
MEQKGDCEIPGVSQFINKLLERRLTVVGHIRKIAAGIACVQSHFRPVNEQAQTIQANKHRAALVTNHAH